MVIIKNVILYDTYQNVVGFCELKNVDGQTRVKVKHNLNGVELLTTINGAVAGDTVFPEINLEREVMVCLLQKNGNAVSTYASGIINPKPPTANLPSKPFSKSIAALPPLQAILADTAEKPIKRNTAVKTADTIREIDEVLRAVCTIDERKKGACQTCPYRDFFYGEEIQHKA